MNQEQRERRNAEQRRLDEHFATLQWAAAEQAVQRAQHARRHAYTAATILLWSANAAVWCAVGWLIWDMTR